MAPPPIHHHLLQSMAFYFLYPASAALSATLICSLAKMAPVPADGSSSRHSETNAPNGTTSATASMTTPPSQTSHLNNENPFIQFRRFADSQISSILQSVIGLPSLLERPSPTARWIVIQRDGDGNDVYVDGDKVTMRQRREMEEGWRKQREQEAEERARAVDAVRGEEMKKWGCNVDAAASQVLPTRATAREEDETGAKRNGGLLDRLGWDGRQKQEDKQTETSDRRGPITMPSVRMTVNEKDMSQSLNPFSGNMTEAASWLLTNEYSPIFLRGHIPRDIDRNGPSFYHALYHPHWPDFRAASTRDHFEDELRFRVPWCDAFEDLVSLQHNGHMVDRDEPTRTSSAQWLNDIIRRGSLGPIMSRGLGGPQWSTEYARAVLPFGSDKQPKSIMPRQTPPTTSNEDDFEEEDDIELDPILMAVDIIEGLAKEASPDDGTDDFGSTKQWADDISDSLIQAVLKDLKKPGVLDELRRLGFTSETGVLEYLLGDQIARDFRGFLVAPPDVVAAAMRAATASEKQPNEKEENADKPHDRKSLETLEEYEKQLVNLEQKNQVELSKAGYTQTSSPPVDQSSSSEESTEASAFTSSSSSTSSWSRGVADDGKKESIVTTMTTTERRTLADGTVETKRVLKKKFADGREESNESVERQMPSSSNFRPALSKPLNGETSSTAMRDKQTQTNAKNDSRPKRSGWFWRE